MKAAVVDTFEHPPRYRDFDQPLVGDDEVLVSVEAAAISQLVRAQASGRHYSGGAPPFVPGADGVGRLADGRRVYFAFPRAPIGSMAERVAVKAAYTTALPDDVDDITAAAIANPGMSSWTALRQRAHLQSGEAVLINGATGASGRLAIQIARHLGATRIVATGRNRSGEADLLALGADVFVPLDLPAAALAERFRREIADGIDIVLDYLWGPSAEALIAAATGSGGGQAERRIRFVNIGTVTAPTITLAGGALRSSGLEILGSGLGSVSHADLVGSIGSLMQVVNPAGFRIDLVPIPLTQVETAWLLDTSARIVLTM